MDHLEWCLQTKRDLAVFIPGLIVYYSVKMSKYRGNKVRHLQIYHKKGLFLDLGTEHL